MLLIWIYLIAQSLRAVPKRSFIPLYSQGISINYKNDFILTECCQGWTVHPLSILASPERVLFVNRQLEIQWEIRFFAIPAPVNRILAEQPSTWLSTFAITCLKHDWRCLSKVFITLIEELLKFQKKVARALKISPPGGWGA